MAPIENRVYRSIVGIVNQDDLFEYHEIAFSNTSLCDSTLFPTLINVVHYGDGIGSEPIVSPVISRSELKTNSAGLTMQHCSDPPSGIAIYS